MTGEPCRVCADADRDFGPLVGSRGTGVPRGNETVAYNALVPWVAHVRDLPNAAAHLGALNLRTLSPRTAYLENVLRAAKDSTLMDHPSLKLAPASGNNAIAAALVFHVSGVHTWAHRDFTERIARSWSPERLK